MIGKTVGSYKITKELGQGGMGAVYLAEHTLMGKQAAVKVLLPQFCAVPEVVERFFNEAKAASMIKHPGVVDIYDFGNQDDGSAFIVMELLEGEELTELLAREPRLDSQRVALLGQQVARALEAAHELGIVHRDLKPDNIFLEPDSAATGGVRPKILDFGIAKLGGDLGESSMKTRTGAVMGTPVFMSPEQCTGAGAVDHRADIYSLGCILYLMVCGRAPFVKNGVGALIAAHITEAAEPVSQFEASVDANLEAIIMSTLAKDPEERPQSMSALANALSSISGHQTGKGFEKPQTESPRAVGKPVAAAVSPTTLGATAGATFAPEASTPKGSGLTKSALIAGGVVAAAAAAFFVIGSRGETSASEPAVSASAPTEAAPAAVAPTVTAEPEVPKKIQLLIETEPEGVSVYNALTGVNLGKTPYRDERPRAKGALELMLKLEGYESRIVSVPLQEDFSESVALLATETAAVAPKEQDGKKPDRRSRPSAAEAKAAKAAERRIRDEKARQAAAEKARAQQAASAKARQAAAEKAAAKKPETQWGELAD